MNVFGVVGYVGKINVDELIPNVEEVRQKLKLSSLFVFCYLKLKTFCIVYLCATAAPVAEW